MNFFNRTMNQMFYLYRKGGVFRFLSRVGYHIIRIVYHCDIPPSLNIENVYFCHKGFGIVINAKTVIGSGTVIQHGVTIGEKEPGGLAPQIGANCYIGAKATVIGNICVGDGAKIGAGAVVLSNVSGNKTAVGVPARIVN